MSVHTLYRFYDADDVLLYVGQSVNPGRRMEKHRDTQTWWRDVARIEMEQHPDKVTLLAAEREAIKEEKPLHNVRMNGRRVYRQLIWTCEVCDHAIDDHEGYVTVSYTDMGEYGRLRDEWERTYLISDMPLKAYNVGALAYHPDLPRWRVLHRDCDPRPTSNDYWISVERIRTLADVIHWSAHLMNKKWIQETTWTSVLETVMAQT